MAKPALYPQELGVLNQRYKAGQAVEAVHILKEALKTRIKTFLEAVLEGEKETLMTSCDIGIGCKGAGQGHSFLDICKRGNRLGKCYNV